MQKARQSPRMVDSPIGKVALDHSGSAIGAARMDPAKAYCATPLLLQEYINSGSEKAWQEIRQRIDNIYITVSHALEALEAEEPFSKDVLGQIKAGKKLFFKPNLVLLPAIDFETHAPVLTGTCLPWEFQAAVMRWFHDKAGITYHQMATGEAGTATSSAAVSGCKACGQEKVTTQALMEGKYGEDCGGWGFYFARQYLAESHDPAHTDDPLRGYQESLEGACLPPGKAPDKLLVYDLNKINDDFCDGREVPVADGVNFKTITLHKAIIGGDPRDPQDIRDWPGCVLINLCKLKIHITELFTCSIKNLGIGLYPMEASAAHEPGKHKWKYAVPPLQVPLFKMGVPHRRWMNRSDPESGWPVRGQDGHYIWTRTGGLEGSMADAVQAVRGQGVKMLHVADAIETVNIHHSGPGCTPVPEGFVLAASDMVALDNCASRYLFSMLPMAEAAEISRRHNLKSDVIQKVPMPEIDGKNIRNGEGYDAPLSRYGLLKHFQDRGLGRPEFYVAGEDLWEGGRLASLRQHLGSVDQGQFSQFLTDTMYHTPNKPLWDLQATCLKYLELDDKLTGSNFRQKVLEAYDEGRDGVIDYMETGKGDHPGMIAYGATLNIQDIDPLEASKLRFLLAALLLKLMNKGWNPHGHDIGEQGVLAQALAVALAMCNSQSEQPDPLFPGRTWGTGKWPSFPLAIRRLLLNRIYGPQFPDQIDPKTSLYGLASGYAASRGLPYTLYVPPGFGTEQGQAVPHVVETADPALIFTAAFEGGQPWNELHVSSYNLK